MGLNTCNNLLIKLYMYLLTVLILFLNFRLFLYVVEHVMFIKDYVLSSVESNIKLTPLIFD